MSDIQIDRRIEFLIKEANSKQPIRDQTVTYAFRVITNHLSVGDDVSSNKLSRECKYRSKKAHELFLTNPGGWLVEVTNEHQYPLKRAWAWMLDQGPVLTVQRVREHLQKWPVVVVTRDENKLLQDDPEIGPDQRYEDAGIEVLKMTASGDWKPISPSDVSD